MVVGAGEWLSSGVASPGVDASDDEDPSSEAGSLERDESCFLRLGMDIPSYVQLFHEIVRISRVRSRSKVKSGCSGSTVSRSVKSGPFLVTTSDCPNEGVSDDAVAGRYDSLCRI